MSYLETISANFGTGEGKTLLLSKEYLLIQQDALRFTGKYTWISCPRYKGLKKANS